MINNLHIKVVSEEYLSVQQNLDIKALHDICFSDIPREEIEEDFIAKPFARILVYDEKELVGIADLYKRDIEYKGQKINLGGFGGLCVKESLREHGIGKQIGKKALEILHKHVCDIVFLSIDLQKKTKGFYEKLGFVELPQQFSWENFHGQTKKDKGGMLAPLGSQELFQEVLNDKSILHVGKGYW